MKTRISILSRFLFSCVYVHVDRNLENSSKGKVMIHSPNQLINLLTD